MRFTAIRHGQSDYNIRELCNDKPEIPVSLTELGKQQAEEAVARLKNCKLSKIVVSPLLRTRQTADIINRSLRLPLAVDDRLCDIHTGFDSRPVADYMAFIASDPLHTKITGYESLLEHQARVCCLLDELYEQGEDQLLLVAHEETLRVFKAWSENLELSSVVGLPFKNAHPYEFKKQGNCS